MMRNCFRKKNEILTVNNLGGIFSINKKYLMYIAIGVGIYFAIRNIKPLRDTVKKLPLIGKVV